jgi:hypothetical protein
MIREKSAIEKSETYQEEAARLRYALHVIHGMDSLEEAKRVAWAAMRGELHGHEMPPAKKPDPAISRGPL